GAGGQDFSVGRRAPLAPYCASNCEGPPDSNNHRTGAGGDASYPLPGGPSSNSSRHAHVYGAAHGGERGARKPQSVSGRGPPRVGSRRAACYLELSFTRRSAGQEGLRGLVARRSNLHTYPETYPSGGARVTRKPALAQRQAASC